MTASKTQLQQELQDDDTESLSDEDAAIEDEEQSNASQHQDQDQDQDQDDIEIDLEALLPTPEHLRKYALEGQLQGNVSTISEYLCFNVHPTSTYEGAHPASFDGPRCSSSKLPSTHKSASHSCNF